MKIEKALELCLDQITGQYETSGSWDRVTNNFDGFGPSIGIIQFCWGMGSLQEVIHILRSWVPLTDFFDKDKADQISEALKLSLSSQRKLADRKSVV